MALVSQNATFYVWYTCSTVAKDEMLKTENYASLISKMHFLEIKTCVLLVLIFGKKMLYSLLSTNFFVFVQELTSHWSLYC